LGEIERPWSSHTIPLVDADVHPWGSRRMLRVYFLQQCMGWPIEALEDAIYDSQAMRIFVGIDLSVESVPECDDAAEVSPFARRA